MYLNDFITSLENYNDDVYFYDYRGEFLCQVRHGKLWNFFISNGTKIKIFSFAFVHDEIHIHLDLGFEEGDDEIISRFISLWN